MESSLKVTLKAMFCLPIFSLDADHEKVVECGTYLEKRPMLLLLQRLVIELVLDFLAFYPEIFELRSESGSLAFVLSQNS